MAIGWETTDMPTSFQAAAVLAIELLPGAMYIWSFERQAGRWGIGLSDRVLRFVGASAIFHAFFAPASYWFWSTQWPKLKTPNPKLKTTPV